MNELKAYRIKGNTLGDFDDVYIKSEADAIIAELKDKLRHYPIMVKLLESDKKEIAKKDKEIAEKNAEIRKLNFELWSARYEAAKAESDEPRMARCRYMADKFKDAVK